VKLLVFVALVSPSGVMEKTLGVDPNNPAPFAFRVVATSDGMDFM
jgi:hypothetical protein